MTGFSESSIGHRSSSGGSAVLGDPDLSLLLCTALFSLSSSLKQCRRCWNTTRPTKFSKWLYFSYSCSVQIRNGLQYSSVFFCSFSCEPPLSHCDSFYKTNNKHNLDLFKDFPAVTSASTCVLFMISVFCFHVFPEPEMFAEKEKRKPTVMMCFQISHSCLLWDFFF